MADGSVGGGGGGATLRLDVFLWHARLARTRAAARALIASGRPRLDGRLVERAHTPVRVGSVLVFAHASGVRAVRVEALPTRRGPFPEARACYSDIVPGEASPANVSQQAPLD